MFNFRALPLFVLTMAGVLPALRANDRNFAYAYESAVLPAGEREVEFSTTWRHGRDGQFYSEFDHRAELEWGLGGNWQTSFYLNWQQVTAENFDPVTGASLGNSHAFEFKGISSEWKYKLLDPVADRIGLALYGELSLGSDEVELESKLILDKKIGRHLFAYNLVGEYEVQYTPGHRASALKIQNDLGYSLGFGDHFSAGLELNTRAERAGGVWEYHALYAGPVIHYTAKNWWVTLTALQQLPALKKSAATPDSRYIFDEQERTNIRLLLSHRF